MELTKLLKFFMYSKLRVEDVGDTDDDEYVKTEDVLDLSSLLFELLFGILLLLLLFVDADELPLFSCVDDVGELVPFVLDVLFKLSMFLSVALSSVF